MSQYRICCDTMSVQLTHECEQHPDRFNCPGVLIVYDAKLDEYGMPIRDDGHSVMSIQFCSWWGAPLPESKRELWFETLEKIGFDDPIGQPVPDDFRTDKWCEAQIDRSHGNVESTGCGYFSAFFSMREIRTWPSQCAVATCNPSG